MKKLKMAETSKVMKQMWWFFGAPSAPRKFLECTFCRAARQVQVRSAPTTKNYTIHVCHCLLPSSTDRPASLPLSVVCRPWSVVRGPWSVVRGPWSVVCGPCFCWASVRPFVRPSVVRGPWSVVRGPLSVVRGPWSVVRGP